MKISNVNLSYQETFTYNICLIFHIDRKDRKNVHHEMKQLYEIISRNFPLFLSSVEGASSKLRGPRFFFESHTPYMKALEKRPSAECTRCAKLPSKARLSFIEAKVFNGSKRFVAWRYKLVDIAVFDPFSNCVHSVSNVIARVVLNATSRCRDKARKSNGRI